MRRALLPLCLALTACSKPAPQAEPQSVAAPSQPAPAYDPWPGKYEGDLMVRISPIHRVTLITANGACTGDAGLAGGAPSQTDAPDRLRVTLNDTATNAVCHVVLTRQGDRLTVSEDGDCSAWHGATCAFSGTAQRVK